MAQKRFEKTYDADGVAVADEREENEPTDEQLLAGFHSHYEKFSPDQIIRGALNEPGQKVADLIERDRAIFLRQRRAALAQEQANKQAEEQRTLEKQRALEKAQRQEARTALQGAVSSLQSWIAKRDELRDSLQERESTLQNLLDNQGAEIDLEALKKQTSEIADCRLLADALRARLSAWRTKEASYLTPLRAALGAAQGELCLLHQSEREGRLSKARQQLGALIDLAHLRELIHQGGGGHWADLAEAAYPVIKLDLVIGYSRGSYRWNYPLHDNQLLSRAAELERYYEALLPELEKE
jgi:hypothetical protein